MREKYLPSARRMEELLVTEPVTRLRGGADELNAKSLCWLPAPLLRVDLRVPPIRGAAFVEQDTRLRAVHAQTVGYAG
jgi:hypothetical protein